MGTLLQVTHSSRVNFIAVDVNPNNKKREHYFHHDLIF